jgi:hypothetical protein
MDRDNDEGLDTVDGGFGVAKTTGGGKNGSQYIVKEDVKRKRNRIEEEKRTIKELKSENENRNENRKEKKKKEIYKPTLMIIIVLTLAAV